MSRKLPTGKVPAEILKQMVFPYCGIDSNRVIQGPGIGVDSAALDMGDKALILKANPITGAESKIGWLAVHINANDVATCGARPLWFMVNILLPEGANTSLLETIMKEIHEACCNLEISVIGGHTESVIGLNRTIISGFMIGESSKSECLTPKSVKLGDSIILTKGVGLEGTGILASDLRDILSDKVDDATLDEAVKLLESVSVVKEALTAYEVGGVKYMHTPTEGGLLNGVWEMAEAAGVGVELWKDEIPILSETYEICSALNLDPLRLLNSGGLLLVVNPEKSIAIISALKEVGVHAKVIGKTRSLKEGRILIHDGIVEPIDSVKQDELFRILEKYDK